MQAKHGRRANVIYTEVRDRRIGQTTDVFFFLFFFGIQFIVGGLDP
jgi:hypothetical protein